jgi:hypothetical protein
MPEFQIGHAVTYRLDTHPEEHGKPLTILRLMNNNLCECITPDRKKLILSTASLERVRQRRHTDKKEREMGSEWTPPEPMHPEVSFDTAPVALPDFVPEEP